MSELVSPIKVGPAKDVLLLHDGSPFAKTVARLLALDYRLGAFLETVCGTRGEGSECLQRTRLGFPETHVL